ncbi:MAG: hypothetical protein AAF151_22285 [Cyanobacteria bacterium J06656_5]
MSTSYPIQVVVGLRQSKVNPKVISRASFDRVIDPLKFLQNQGLVQIQYATTLNELKKLRNTEIRQVLFFNGAFSEADLVFFKNAKEVGYKVVYDIDTYLLQYPSYSNIQNKKTLVKEIAQYADFITVANEKLFYAFQGLGHVLLIGNSYDVRKYTRFNQAKSHDTRKVVITNADNFKLTDFRKEFFRLLIDLVNSHKVSEIHLFSDFLPPELEHERIIYRGFVEREAHRKILAEGDFHLALVPIDAGLSFDDWTFNVSKNPFKYFIYAAAEIPVVYSSNPLYTPYIMDGHNGMICRNSYSEWSRKITDLLEDSSLCKLLARNAFEDVKNTFDITRMCHQYKDLLHLLTT